VTRRVFVVTGAIAANGPDIDLVYTGLTEEPLGYLLHHRGHSHTLPGLIVLGGLIWIALRLWPAARTAVAEASTRCGLLIASALVSHLLMDTANSYGTHLLYPFSSRWVFGDAVFIFEPWGWLLLGTALAMNAAGRWLRALVWLLALVPIVALALLGLISTGILLTLVGAGAAGAILSVRAQARARAAIALAAMSALFLMLFGLSRLVGAEVRHGIESRGGAVVDVLVNATAGVPWCWVVLAVERERDAGPDRLLARRGTLSLLPRIAPARSCAFYPLVGGEDADRGAASSELAWTQEWRIDLVPIRTLDRTDCRVRAWLQFGRVPYVIGDRILDLRFAQPLGGDFGSMTIRPAASGCPSNLTDWEPPRRDVLDR